MAPHGQQVIPRPVHPKLMLILGRRTGRMSLSDLAEAAAAGGVDAVQLRMPGAAPERVREVVAAVRERIGERAVVLVNGAAPRRRPSRRRWAVGSTCRSGPGPRRSRRRGRRWGLGR
jgi:hypothetical protein